jgi:drug/metabolite transporter (DMT)-like permease
MTNAVLFLITVLIWGSTWLAIEFQLGVVAAEVSLVYRYLLASALAFCWCWWRGISLRFDLRSHMRFMLLGTFLFGLNYLSAYKAQLFITSALNAIGFSALVWMNIINARIFFGARTDRQTYLGASLGCAGIVIVFWPSVQKLSWSDTVLLGAMLSLLGALLASFGNMVSHAIQQKSIAIMQANAWGMLYGAVLNALIALAAGTPFNFDPSRGYVLSLLYLSGFGSVIAFGCYLSLIARVGVQRAGYTAVMVPVVALLLSALFEGLTVDRYIISGVVLALLGNISVLARR